MQRAASKFSRSTRLRIAGGRFSVQALGPYLDGLVEHRSGPARRSLVHRAYLEHCCDDFGLSGIDDSDGQYGDVFRFPVSGDSFDNPCSPAAVRIARDAYGRWHAALRQLAKE